jgi:hypothetical protein
MSNTTDKIIKKLKQENIQPRPRKYFVLRNIVLWGFFGVTVFVGSIAFSALLFRLSNASWGIYKNLGRHPINHFFLTIPYLWIGLVVIFSILAVYNFRHTPRGYRYRPILVIVISVLAGMVIGTILFFAGYGNYFDYKLVNSRPFRGFVEEPYQKTWSQPEKGLLGGKILEIHSDDNFVLGDFEGKSWLIEFRGEKRGQKKFILPGENLRLQGEVISENIFTAFEIRPWRNGPNPKFPVTRQLNLGRLEPFY